MQQDFLGCVQSQWQLGFNDPYLLSWVMVAIYSLTAGVAVAVARRAPLPDATERRERAFWIALAIVLALMAINKQADLQTLLLSSGRCFLQVQGMYDQQGALKSIALVALGLIAIISGVTFIWALFPTLKRTALPLLGVALIAGFIVFRAAETLNKLGPLRGVVDGNWPDRILELSGPVIVLFAAIRLLSRREKHTL